MQFQRVIIIIMERMWSGMNHHILSHPILVLVPSVHRESQCPLFAMRRNEMENLFHSFIRSSAAANYDSVVITPIQDIRTFITSIHHRHHPNLLTLLENGGDHSFNFYRLHFHHSSSFSQPTHPFQKRIKTSHISNRKRRPPVATKNNLLRLDVFHSFFGCNSLEFNFAHSL